MGASAGMRPCSRRGDGRFIRLLGDRCRLPGIDGPDRDSAPDYFGEMAISHQVISAELALSIKPAADADE